MGNTSRKQGRRVIRANEDRDIQMKTTDEEIQHLGLMITATRKEDTNRLAAIGQRLIELSKTTEE